MRGWFIKGIKRIDMQLGAVLACLGVVVAAFVPIMVFVMQEGIELRIDKLVVIDNVLSLNWYVWILFAIILVVLAKMLVDGKKNLFSGLVNIVLILLLLLLTGCSYVAFRNSVMWLSDVPASVATDNTYTSNPLLSEYFSGDLNKFVGVRVNEIPDYKKRSRLKYIQKIDSVEEKESLWEMFWNDNNSYEYEAKNDFWIYLGEYYDFLRTTSDEEVVRRGFETMKVHVKDLGSYTDESNHCSYVSSTLLNVKDGEDDWRVELWSELVAQYIAVALSEVNVYSNTRACWLGSLPWFLNNEVLGIDENEHLGVLTNALWNAYNSFEVQNSVSHAFFYDDVPEYIVGFYNVLIESKSAEEFYERVLNYLDYYKGGV